MAEYDRIQKKQESRAVGNNKCRRLQMKCLVDCRSQILSNKSIDNNSLKVLQRGRINSRFKKLNTSSTNAEKRRAMRTRILDKKKGKYTNRNKLIVTYDVNDLRISFFLKSAGLGGRHPISDGRSASHTEAMWQAIRKKHPTLLVRRMNSKLQRHRKSLIRDISEAKCVSIISTNSPCKSSPRDKKEGCGGIDDSEMGADDKTAMLYLREYQKDSRTERKCLEDAGVDLSLPISDYKDDDSSDDEMDTDKMRGKDFDDVNDVKGMFQ